MKLTEKVRVGGRYRKKYDKPKTPADRVLAWKGLDRQQAASIQENQRELNPFELSRAVETSLKKAFEILKELRAGEAELENEIDEPLVLPSVTLRSHPTTSVAPSAPPKAKQSHPNKQLNQNTHPLVRYHE